MLVRQEEARRAQQELERRPAVSPSKAGLLGTPQPRSLSLPPPPSVPADGLARCGAAAAVDLATAGCGGVEATSCQDLSVGQSSPRYVHGRAPIWDAVRGRLSSPAGESAAGGEGGASGTSATWDESDAGQSPGYFSGIRLRTCDLKAAQQRFNSGSDAGVGLRAIPIQYPSDRVRSRPSPSPSYLFAGQPTFAPRINAASSLHRNRAPVEEILLQKGKLASCRD